MKRPVILKMATPASKVYHEALSALSANLSLAGGRLQFLIALMKIVFSDEDFITAIEAEGLITIPSFLNGTTRREKALPTRIKSGPPHVHRPFVLALAQKSEALWEEITTRQRPLLDDLLYLQIYIAYIDKWLADTRIRRYLVKNHNVTLSKIEKLIASVNLSTVDLKEDSMTVWSLARAQKDLAKLIKQAQTNGPQHIKKRHEPCVIVISTRRWNAMLRRYPELEEFFFQRQCPWTKKVGRVAPQQPDAQAARFD